MTANEQTTNQTDLVLTSILAKEIGMSHSYFKKTILKRIHSFRLTPRRVVVKRSDFDRYVQSTREAADSDCDVRDIIEAVTA